MKVPLAPRQALLQQWWLEQWLLRYAEALDVMQSPMLSRPRQVALLQSNDMDTGYAGWH